ncbi:hypothetical protein TNCV_1218431 [Trichonephila clavipes]|nr:hypothetical protein TNCV_1218431 [Trichonephila clavipes]
MIHPSSSQQLITINSRLRLQIITALHSAKSPNCSTARPGHQFRDRRADQPLFRKDDDNYHNPVNSPPHSSRHIFRTGKLKKPDYVDPYCFPTDVSARTGLYLFNRNRFRKGRAYNQRNRV